MLTSDSRLPISRAAAAITSVASKLAYPVVTHSH